MKADKTIGFLLFSIGRLFVKIEIKYLHFAHFVVDGDDDDVIHINTNDLPVFNTYISTNTTKTTSRQTKYTEQRGLIHKLLSSCVLHLILKDFSASSL